PGGAEPSPRMQAQRKGAGSSLPSPQSKLWWEGFEMEPWDCRVPETWVEQGGAKSQ
ncbi:hypothetical protein P7K49_012877, partial [Saguinus oedipus]